VKISAYFITWKGRSESIKIELLHYVSSQKTESRRVQDRRNSTQEYIPEKGNKKIWTKTAYTLAGTLIFSIFIAGAVELYLSYILLRQNVPAFFDSPETAIMMGLIPIFAAFIVKFMQYEYSNASEVNKKFLVGGIIISIALFISLQWVFYNMQSMEGMEALSASQAPANEFFNDLNNEVSNSDRESVNTVAFNWDAAYYSISSIVIGVFIYISSGVTVSVFMKHSNAERRTTMYTDLTKDFIYHDDMIATIESCSKKCGSIIEAIDVKTDGLLSETWDELCVKKDSEEKSQDKEKKKEKEEKEKNESIRLRYENRRKLLEGILTNRDLDKEKEELQNIYDELDKLDT